MHISLKTLNNRVARRILLLFVLAAVIPLAILSGLTLYQVSSELKAQSELYLRDTAKSMGMEIFGRLQFLEEELQLLTRHFQQHRQEPGRVQVDLNEISQVKRISGLFILTPEGKRQTLYGNPLIDDQQMIKAIHNQWVPGKSLLMRVVPVASAGVPRLFLFVPIEPGIIGSDLLGAELNIDSLWDTQLMQGRRELICILSEQGSPLYCNRTASADWVARVVDQTHAKSSGQFTWMGQQQKQLTAFWSLFLAPHYQLEKWTIAIGLSEAEAMVAVDKFQMLLPRVVLLTLLVVIFLSIPVIRSNLHPLEMLLSATRRLSQGQFDTRVRLNSRDEFQEVGESFNQMALQLGQQFEHQKFLAELSRELQRADAVDAALHIVFKYLSQNPMVASMAAVCLEDRGGRLISRCYPFHHASPVETQLNKQHVPDFPVAIWQGGKQQMEASYPFLKMLQAQPERILSLVPALKDGQTQAIIALALDGDQALDEAQRGFLKQIGDMLGFTLTGIYLNNRLYFQAHHDPLTGLPNRTLLKEQALKMLDAAEISGQQCAIILFDLDRFKLINDSQGHAAGDDLLVQVAMRLRHCFRADDMVSRFAGDEFVILLGAMDASVVRVNSRKAVEHIDSVFEKPFQIGNWSVRVTASKGVACYPQDGETFIDLLKNADAAMYQAKASKPGSSAFFSSALQASLLQKIKTERALSGAVEREEFLLHYQPVMDIRRNQVVATEALVRWQPPGQGVIPPGDFIGIAEETGIIEEIGYWVLERACSDYQGWLERGVVLDHVAVNVSSHQMQNKNFVERVEAVLDKTGIDPRHLELEVTETALIGSFEQSNERLQKLRSLGVSIAVDDFGTGYSSLKYLKSLPADRLKIDRLFVRELPENKRDGAIISSLVTLSRELGLSILAEGVETEAQAAFLLHASVDIIQGFLYSKPLPEADFLDFVKQVNATAKVQLLRSS